MFRHLHTSINYALLIKMQANQQTFSPTESKKADLKREKNKTKSLLKTHRKRR